MVALRIVPKVRGEILFGYCDPPVNESEISGACGTQRLGETSRTQARVRPKLRADSFTGHRSLQVSALQSIETRSRE